MDLTNPSAEHMAYMIEEIKKKLKMAAAGAMKPEHFPLDSYDDVKDIYEHVETRSQFSITEIESLVSELGRLRKG